MSSTGESAVGSSFGEALTRSAITAGAVTGSHELQINGYSQIKGLGNGKFIKSSAFSIGGHRWCIRYYPDGAGSGSADWISVFLQHDHSTAEDVVKAQFDFCVLDNIGESVSMFKCSSSLATFSSKLPCWGTNKFAKRVALEESTYLKDDCLRVRCDLTISKDITTEATTTLSSVVVPPSNMHQHFSFLLSDAVGADVTFEVAGETFAAHRCVLAARSSVFKAELFGPMKEKTMNFIQIQDMEASVFQAMLHFIYTDALPDIDKGDVIIQHLLVAADRYDLERLKLICEDKLCKCIDTRTVAGTLELAERHGCHWLKKACFEFLKSPCHLKTAMLTDSFDHLMSTYPSLIKDLLAKVATSPSRLHFGCLG